MQILVSFRPDHSDEARLARWLKPGAKFISDLYTHDVIRQMYINPEAFLKFPDACEINGVFLCKAESVEVLKGEFQKFPFIEEEIFTPEFTPLKPFESLELLFSGGNH